MDPKTEKSAFQTKTILRSLLNSAGLSPRKRLGQCFLIDRNLMAKLAGAAELDPTDCVLEVGCGMGSLTALLAAAAGRVVAVEVDPGLLEIAREQLAAHANVLLVGADALKTKTVVAPEVIAAVVEAHRQAGGRLKLVANLPYDIATPLVIDLLIGGLPFERYCFTVQEEVAARFLAQPGTADFGPVAVISQTLTTGRRLTKVPPQAFWPAPKVSSAMLRLDALPTDEVCITDRHAFAQFVRVFFQSRRKTVSHIGKTLASRAETSASRPETSASRAETSASRAVLGPGQSGEHTFLAALDTLGISHRARPENITTDQWISLFQAGVCPQRAEPL